MNNPITSTSSSEQVNRVYNKPNWNEQRKYCSYCGRFAHVDKEICPAADKECRRCHRRGHFERKCRTKLQARGMKRDSADRNYNQNQPIKRQKRIFNVNSEENLKDESIYSLGMNEETVKCHVGGIEINMLIDSGSNYNIIDDCTWDLMKIKGVKIRNERKTSPYRFMAYGKTPLVIVTIFETDIKIRDGENVLKCDDTFFVIEKGQQPLLGKSTAIKLGVYTLVFRVNVLV